MHHHALPAALAVLATLVWAGSAHAQVVTIDQAKALAGNVTPGDLPGFPVTISRPGGYRLTGNLHVVDAGTGAIQLTSSHVTLDLGGFQVRGARCSPTRCVIHPTPASGVLATSGTEGLEVLNGRIDNFTGAGVYAAKGLTLRNVTVQRSGDCGAIAGQDALVVDSRFIANRLCGLSVQTGLARGNVMRDNQLSQLQAAAEGDFLASGNALYGPHPMRGPTVDSIRSTGDNLCRGPSQAVSVSC